MPTTHAKYTRTIYPYIPGDFNYSDQVWYITGPKSGFKLSASCVEVMKTWKCYTGSVPACDTQNSNTVVEKKGEYTYPFTLITITLNRQLRKRKEAGT